MRGSGVRVDGVVIPRHTISRTYLDSVRCEVEELARVLAGPVDRPEELGHVCVDGGDWDMDDGDRFGQRPAASAV